MNIKMLQFLSLHFLFLTIEPSQPFFFRPPRPPETAEEIASQCNHFLQRGEAYIPSWCNIAIRMGYVDQDSGGTTMMATMASSASTAGMRTTAAPMHNWGWSAWSDYTNDCPEVCPRGCQRRSRHCRGESRFCLMSGKASELTNCPELQEATSTDGDQGSAQGNNNNENNNNNQQPGSGDSGSLRPGTGGLHKNPNLAIVDINDFA